MLKIDVQEAITHLELPQTIKQVLHILDRKTYCFTYYITSTIQENDELLPLQIWKFLVGEPWYDGVFAKKIFSLEMNASKNSNHFPQRIGQVNICLSFLWLGKNLSSYLTVFGNGIIIIIPKDYVRI